MVPNKWCQAPFSAAKWGLAPFILFIYLWGLAPFIMALKI
jgi:hypothetical protein